MTQQWDPAFYTKNAGYVAELGQPILELLDPTHGERILDLGCGDGALTAHIHSRTATVVGIDSSPEMVEAAKRRGLTAYVADGEHLEFDKEFEAVFSNAALHWMQNARAVVAGVRRALVPGGRFVAECGGSGNIARIVAAFERVTASNPRYGRFENPWYFPRPEDYRALLQEHGFTVEVMELFDRPTPLERGIRGWLQVFAGHLTDSLPDDLRDSFYDDCEASLRGDLYDADHGWWADYVRLRFRATLTGDGAG